MTACPVQRRFRGNISPCYFSRANSRVGRGREEVRSLLALVVTELQVREGFHGRDMGEKQSC